MTLQTNSNCYHLILFSGTVRTTPAHCGGCSPRPSNSPWAKPSSTGTSTLRATFFPPSRCLKPSSAALSPWAKSLSWPGTSLPFPSPNQAGQPSVARLICGEHCTRVSEIGPPFGITMMWGTTFMPYGWIATGSTPAPTSPPVWRTWTQRRSASWSMFAASSASDPANGCWTSAVAGAAGCICRREIWCQGAGRYPEREPGDLC